MSLLLLALTLAVLSMSSFPILEQEGRYVGCFVRDFPFDVLLVSDSTAKPFGDAMAELFLKKLKICAGFCHFLSVDSPFHPEFPF
ncbi:hypothetical protein Ancab_030847 [Ancistrocladus abbreviatus]